MQILDPVAGPRDATDNILPSIAGLDGRTVGILSNHWKSMDRMAERMRVRLKELYRAADVRFYDIPINGAMTAEVRQHVLSECNAAIVGLAN